MKQKEAPALLSRSPLSLSVDYGVRMRAVIAMIVNPPKYAEVTNFLISKLVGLLATSVSR